MSNSYSTINKMFFLQSDDTDNILDVLDKYMFTKTHESTIITSEPPSPPSISPQPIPETIENTPIIQQPILETKPIPIIEFISPTHQDSLFWCIYIAMHGYNDYQQVSRNYGVKELEIKQKIGDYIKSNASKLKLTNYKVTKACVQEILSELLTSQKETSMICLIAMTVHFNINVALVNPAKKIMVEFIGQKDAELPWYILYKDTYGKYTVQETPATPEQMECLRQSNISLDSYIRPLKAMTTYKIDDFLHIATKLGSIDLTVKIKKPELYEQISNRIQWT
jgi:hypothetical protein